MRTIKFRAWDKKNKWMLNWLDNMDEILCAIPYDCGDEWTEQCELMQFTGLHDKNGKEIYEGDIIKAKYVYPDVSLDLEYRRIRGSDTVKLYCEIVEPLRVRFSMQRDGLFEYQPHELVDIEIIGNVWENPELLE